MSSAVLLRQSATAQCKYLSFRPTLAGLATVRRMQTYHIVRPIGEHNRHLRRFPL